MPTTLDRTYTIDFQNASTSENFVGLSVTDGMAGSQDIPGQTMEVYAADASLQRHNAAAWMYYRLGPSWDDQDGITSAHDDPYYIIHNTNGSAFSFQGITIVDSFLDMPQVKIEAFLGGQSRGYVFVNINDGITGSGTFSYANDLPSSIFETVDQIRISRPDGLGLESILLDNIVVGKPVKEPAVTSVAVPANGTYTAGQTLDFTVQFDEAVVVSTAGGIPQLTLVIGTETIYANYVSNAGTGTLLFRYTVQPEQADANGITIGALRLNSGTIKDLEGMDAGLTLNAVASTTGILVNAVTPEAPSTPDLVPISDTGMSTTDSVTNDTTPTFTGSADSGTTVRLFNDANGNGAIDAGEELGSVVAVNGTWTVTPTLAAGNYTIRAIAQNGSSVGPASPGLALTIDTTAPAATTTPDLTLSSDTGYLPNDNLTNRTTPTFTGSTAEPNGLVRLYANGVEVGSVRADASGYWVLASNTLSGGTYSFTTRVEDQAGNLGPASPGLSVTIDTAAPTLAITSSKSMLKAGETAIITFTFSEDPGSSFTWNGSSGDVTVSGGTLSAITGTGLTRTGTFTPSANTDSGTASITVAAGSYADSAGNIGGGGTSPSLTFDTKLPASPSAPDLDIGSDTGPIIGDYITNDTAPTLTGKAEAGAVVRLYDGGTQIGFTTADAAGNWTITTGTLVQGNHTFAVTAEDAAGNISLASAGRAVSIDTAAPATRIDDAAFSNDTGPSGADFVTRTAAQNIGGTLSAPLAAGEAVYVSFDNGSTWMAAHSSVGSSVWSLIGVTLSGSNTLQVKVTDAAGNDGPVYVRAYVLDTVAPSVAVSSVYFSSDSGSSSTDLVTDTAAQAISGTLSADLAAGETVYISLDNGASWTAAAIDGSRAWSLTGQTLAGSNTLKVKVTDLAGNDGPLYSAGYALDTTAPATPSTPDLTHASDSGVSINDNWTNDTTPTLTGTAENGTIVTLYDDATVVGSGVAVGGSWTISTAALGSGAHQITAISRDAAGNVSSASPSLIVTVDTDAPIAIPSSSTPADDVTDVAPDSNIVLRFDSPVEIGTGGSIILYNVTDGTVLETISYNSPSITGWGSAALTIGPSSPMPGGKTIAVMWSGSAVQDRAGNFVAANATNTFYNFTVKEDPQAPTATNLTQTVAFLEDGGPITLGDIVITDLNSDETVTATLALSDPAAGSLSVGTYGSAISTFDAATGVWTVTGSVADVNAALADVAFTSSSDWSQTITIAARIRDAAGTGPADGTITLSATPRNDAPTSGNGTVTLLEDSPYVFKAADFAFVDAIDAPANAFLSLVIDGRPDQGALSLNGGAVVAGQEISIADIVSGKLVFTPGINEYGAGLPYSSFTFRVRDNGGTANGGINTSAQYAMRIDVTAVNDPAVIGGDVSGVVTEDTVPSASGTLTVSDVDLTEAGFQALADVRGSYGTFSFDHLTGQWTYLLDNGSPAVQALENGEGKQETFTVKAVDGTEKSVTVTINGASDTSWVDLDNTISGGSRHDSIFGGAGEDRLSGAGGNDRLDGGSGNDTVSGGSGNDRVYGGSGNDRVYGDSGNDRLYGDDGNDRLSGGSGNDLIFGGSGRDTISGGSGNDKIYSGLGADLLNGGAGRDSFVFDTKPGKGNVDTIHGFNPLEDRIILDNAVFKKVGSNGTLDEDAFWWGKEAHDASDRILYDLFTGTLSYDADGTGSGASVKIAQMDPWLLFNHESFRII